MSDELKIDYSSVYTLERELITFPEKLAKYHKLAAKAITEVDRLNLKLEVMTAQILEQIQEEAVERGKPYPPTAVQELRKSKVPLNPKYKKLKLKLIEAVENKNILNGVVKSIEAKGYRLQELVSLAMKRFDFSVEDKLKYD